VTFLGDNKPKLWALASMVACAVAFSGCESCDDNILNIGGAKLDGPATVQPGVPATFTVTGQIGPGKKCPKILQMSYVEVNAAGRPLTTATASKGVAKDRKVKSKKTSQGCKLSIPVHVALAISPGRTDQHRVKVTASLHGPKPQPPDPKHEPIVQLGKAFGALSVGEDSKIVTVVGTVANQPPTAAFITSQSPAITGQPLALDARQSKDPDGSIVKYEWDLNNDGTYEKSSTSPTGVQVDAAAASSQPIRLRVTDDKGAQGTSALSSVPSQPSSQVYAGGSPTLSSETATPGQGITVTPKTTSPPPNTADLYCDDVFTSTVNMQQSFGTPCTFAALGYHVVAVTYRDNPSSSTPYTSTTYYRLVQVVPAARSAAKKKAVSLAVPLSLSGAKLKRLGKVKYAPTSAIVRGLLATGTGKGKVPKGTPKAYRNAMQTLASGRFAVSYSGSARLLNTNITLGGKATMLVRSRHSRKTQVCLSVKAANGGGNARFKVLGATGRARGFGASGIGPVLTFGKGTGRSTTVTLTPKKGRAHGLSRSCRSLSRVLSGKKKKH
jgi:hypothetical protein